MYQDHSGHGLWAEALEKWGLGRVQALVPVIPLAGHHRAPVLCQALEYFGESKPSLTSWLGGTGGK